MRGPELAFNLLLPVLVGLILVLSAPPSSTSWLLLAIGASAVVWGRIREKAKEALPPGAGVTKPGVGNASLMTLIGVVSCVLAAILFALTYAS